MVWEFAERERGFRVAWLPFRIPVRIGWPPECGVPVMSREAFIALSNTDRARFRRLLRERLECMCSSCENVPLCWACGVPERSKIKRLAIDHDHTTGAVRGLLCRACNCYEGQSVGAQYGPRLIATRGVYATIRENAGLSEAGRGVWYCRSDGTLPDESWATPREHM